MKAFRVLGALFFIFGFIFALVGILSSVIPLIENEHFQIILRSFQETSTDTLTNTLNAVVRFCLHSAYFLFFCGISLMVAGGLISASAHKKQNAGQRDIHAARPLRPAAEADGEPKPAYYPGGLAPSAPGLRADGEDEEGPPPRVISTIASLKAAPISGGIEPAVALDDNDAQKLMRHDELLLTQAQQPAEKPSPPDYTRYTSNMESDNEPETAPSEPAHKPRIVSTMGRRRV